MAAGRVVAYLFLFIICAPVLQADEGAALPQIEGRISDHAGVLSDSQKRLLHQMLSQHQFARHQYVAILTAESSGADTVDEYAARIWQAWQSDKKPTSVLLLLTKEEKKAAIVTGERLQGLLTKTEIKALLDESVSTPMLHGDYDNAAMEGVKRIVGELNG